MNADTVFTFTYGICVAAFLGALLLCGVRRKKADGVVVKSRGRVSMGQFHDIDILGVGLFLLLFGVILVLTQMPPELGADGEPKPLNLTPMGIFVGLISQQFIFAFIMLVLLLPRGVNLVEMFGLKWRKFYLALPLAFLVVGIFYALVIFAHALGYADWMKEMFGDDAKLQDVVRIYQGIDAVEMRMILAFAVIVVAPVCEEFLFRGYIYGAAKRLSGRVFACLLSSLVFSLVHFNINALLPLLVLAILLVIAYEWTGSIWAPISIHALFNATTVINMELGSGPVS